MKKLLVVLCLMSVSIAFSQTYYTSTHRGGQIDTLLDKVQPAVDSINSLRSSAIGTNGVAGYTAQWFGVDTLGKGPLAVASKIYFTTGAVESTSTNSWDKFPMGVQPFAVTVDSTHFICLYTTAPNFTPTISYGTDPNATGTSLGSYSAVTSSHATSAIGRGAQILAGNDVWVQWSSITTKPRRWMAMIWGHADTVQSGTLFTDNFSAALGGSWATGGTYSTSGGYLTNVVNLLSTETMSTPGMESFATGDTVALNWSRGGSTSHFSHETAKVHSGGSSQKVFAPIGPSFYQGGATKTGNDWYMMSIWDSSDANGAVLSVSNTSNFPVYFDAVYSTGTSWKQMKSTVRAKSAGTGSGLQITLNDGTSYLDDASMRQIMDSTLFALVTVSTENVICQVEVTTPAGKGLIGGVAVNMDSYSNPRNGVIGYTDGNVVVLEKIVDSVYTTLIAPTAITYGAGKVVKVAKSGTTYKLYYDGAQIGTDQTVSDAGIISNKKHGVINTGVQLDNFSIVAN